MGWNNQLVLLFLEMERADHQIWFLQRLYRLMLLHNMRSRRGRAAVPKIDAWENERMSPMETDRDPKDDSCSIQGLFAVSFQGEYWKTISL